MLDYQEKTWDDDITVRPVWALGEPPQMLLCFFYDDVDRAKKVSAALREQLELRGYEFIQESPEMLALSEGVGFGVLPHDRDRAQALVDFKDSFNAVRQNGVKLIPLDNLEVEVKFVGQALNMDIRSTSEAAAQDALSLTRALQRELTTLRYNVRQAPAGTGLVAEIAGGTKDLAGQFGDFKKALTSASRGHGLREAVRPVIF